MRCRKCGNEIHNVPEHLRDLADWVCQQCVNSVPRRNPAAATSEPEAEHSARHKERAA